jgi:hypothetical protein
MLLLDPEKGRFCNEYEAVLWLGRPLCSGCMATTETAKTGCAAAMETVELA